MLRSPFILKLAYYVPNSINQSKNVAHIDYIAHRPGADKGDPEIGDPEYAAKNYLDSASIHVKYIDERPGSHGLFGENDEIPNFKQIQNKIKNHKGIVWRMVVSLNEDDAKIYNFIDRKYWEEAMRRSIPELADDMGIREENLKWVGAYHPKEGHPHVHLVLWESSPERTRGVLNVNDLKKTFFREMFAPERERLNREKTIAREEIRKIAKGDVQKTVRLLKEIDTYKLENIIESGTEPGIAPELRRKSLEELGNRLHDLKEIMPKQGRIAFKYMPENVKTKVLEIADWILKQPGFQDTLREYYKAVEDMSRFYMKYNHDNALANAHEDIRTRVAQFVVRGAAELSKTTVFELVPRNIGYAKNVLMNTVTFPTDSEKINKIARSYTRLLIATGTEREDAIKLLTDWKLRNGINFETDKLVDNAIKAKVNTAEWGKDMIVPKKEWNDLFKAINQEPPAWAWRVTTEAGLKINTVWKSAWRAIAQEKKKVQAKAELEKRREFEKIRSLAISSERSKEKDY